MSIKISIVTPSYNQGHYLEETLKSVVHQQYANLEYIVMDGGSTDQSVELLSKYDSYLSKWMSHPDNGQYDAINQGFLQTTGEIMGWLNSDDKYLPWTFQIVDEIFSSFPEIEWVTSGRPMVWDQHGRAVHCRALLGFNASEFFRGVYTTGIARYSTGWIQQESTFWRRSLWERAGGWLDTTLNLAADFELWSRFFQHAQLYTVYTPLAGFRVWRQQKSTLQNAQYIAEAQQVLAKHSTNYNHAPSFIYKGIHALPRSLAKRLHLLAPYPVCIYNNDESKWNIMQV